MISKNDVLILLTELEQAGEKDARSYFKKALLEGNVSADTLKYINDRRPMEIAEFYQLLRKNYNHKKSPLYKNIVKEEYTDPTEVLTTLASLNLQILLFNKKLPAEAQSRFLSHSRADEIVKVLGDYYQTFNLRPCLKLLYLIKSDLKVFESI